MLRKTVLVYDPELEKSARLKLESFLQDFAVDFLEFNDQWTAGLPEETLILTWLSDAQLLEVVPVVMGHNWTLSLLPHPLLKQARLGFGVSAKLDEAIADAFNEGGLIEVDLMRCNERIAFNSVIIGDPLSVTPGTMALHSFAARVMRFLNLVRTARQAVLREMTFETHKGKSLETAAVSIVVVQHGRSSTMTRRVLSDSAVNDGMLNALILAPRSVLQVLGFVFASLFLRRSGEGRLPPFAGHIKTQSLRISASRSITYLVDGEEFESKQIDLRVEKNALQLQRGRHLAVDESPPDEKEIYRVQMLPSGDAAYELTQAAIPWLLHASTEEFKELFQLLRQNARASNDYLVLMVLSTILATFGLFANSAPVIIGAMILAPLMAPMISLAMGILRQDTFLQTESTKSLLWGISLALLGSVLLTLFTPLQTINSEIAARLTPTLLDLGVAVVSGVAGAYAHARSEVARSLAGVAIAVALVPPLAVAGIGIGWGDASVFLGATLLFLTNLAGILLAAAFTFLCMGYSAFSLARRGLITATVLVCVISVPLAISFQRMVDEHQIVRQLDGWVVQEVKIRDVHINRLRPLEVSVELVSTEVLDIQRIDAVKQEIETRLKREVHLEARVSLRR